MAAKWTSSTPSWTRRVISGSTSMRRGAAATSSGTRWWIRIDSGSMGRDRGGLTSERNDSPSRTVPPRIGTMPTERMGSLPGRSPPSSRSSAQYTTESHGRARRKSDPSRPTAGMLPEEEEGDRHEEREQHRAAPGHVPEEARHADAVRLGDGLHHEVGAVAD